jgi:hypothetical protein
MLAVFCLRLACGMLACLILLPPEGGAGTRGLVDPRFYRTHFLTALGLACLAFLGAPETAPGPIRALLAGGAALAFAGSLSWSLEGAPGGRALAVLTPVSLAGGLAWLEAAGAESEPLTAVLLGDLASAALLGAALTAMLMGHSYLIAPAMSLRPLMRLLLALALALAARAAADGVALWLWTARHSFGMLGNDVLVWLPLRWGAGFVAPLVLLWMAWQSARIRSTQSATGILYVAVVFCFVGELTGLLLRQTGVTM